VARREGDHGVEQILSSIRPGHLLASVPNGTDIGHDR
jgi:hypothetical protein